MQCAYRILAQELTCAVSYPAPPRVADEVAVRLVRQEPCRIKRSVLASTGHADGGRVPTWDSEVGSWRVEWRTGGSEGRLADWEAAMRCGVRSRRREARGTLLACRPKLSVTSSMNPSPTIPFCPTVPRWTDWQSGRPHWGAPRRGGRCRPAGPRSQR